MASIETLSSTRRSCFVSLVPERATPQVGPCRQGYGWGIFKLKPQSASGVSTKILPWSKLIFPVASSNIRGRP